MKVIVIAADPANTSQIEETIWERGAPWAFLGVRWANPTPHLPSNVLVFSDTIPSLCVISNAFSAKMLGCEAVLSPDLQGSPDCGSYEEMKLWLLRNAFIASRLGVA